MLTQGLAVGSRACRRIMAARSSRPKARPSIPGFRSRLLLRHVLCGRPTSGVGHTAPWSEPRSGLATLDD